MLYFDMKTWPDSRIPECLPEIESQYNSQSIFLNEIECEKNILSLKNALNVKNFKEKSCSLRMNLWNFRSRLPSSKSIKRSILKVLTKLKSCRKRLKDRNWSYKTEFREVREDRQFWLKRRRRLMWQRDLYAEALKSRFRR